MIALIVATLILFQIRNLWVRKTRLKILDDIKAESEWTDKAIRLTLYANRLCGYWGMVLQVWRWKYQYYLDKTFANKEDDD